MPDGVHLAQQESSGGISLLSASPRVNPYTGDWLSIEDLPYPNLFSISKLLHTISSLKQNLIMRILPKPLTATPWSVAGRKSTFGVGLS